MGGAVLLDPRERLKFIQYRKQQAESCGAIAKQLEQLNPMGLGMVIPEFMQAEKLRAFAYATVAEDLAAVEDLVIQGS